MRLILILLMAAASVHAFQRPVDMRPDVPVEIDPGFFGTKYRQEGRLLKPMSVYNMMEKYPEAKAEMGAAKPLLYTGMVLSGVGGFLVGYPLGSALAGGDFNAPLFFTGVGVMTVGIVLGRMSNNRLMKGVQAYNRTLPAGLGLDWDWTPEQSRMALRFNF